jgi:thiamine kinase-like enzyme
LPKGDRLFLRNLYRTVVEAISNKVLEHRALHGECNSQQTISTSGGLMWLDFEAACLGPREWDLATMDRHAVESYGTVDLSLFSVLKTARLLCVTTWCWTQPDRDPEIRAAAGYHLKNLKRRAAITS